MFSFFKKNTHKKYLALDIGTEVVKALVFEVHPEKEDEKKKSKRAFGERSGGSMRGVVVGVGRQKQRPGNMRSGAVSDISGVIETAREAVEEAKDRAKTKGIEGTVMGIAGELVKGTTTTVHYERAQSNDRIALPELKEIIRQVQHKAYERISRQLAYETGHSVVDAKLINAAIVDVRIDGYRVKNPIGFQGRNVSIGVFNAYAPLVHLGALGTIADELNIGAVNVSAEPYAVARAVAPDDPVEWNAVSVDVGGGTTDVAVVRGGILEGTKMFPIGGQAFTKHLAYEYKLSLSEAERLKMGHSAGTLTDSADRAVGKIIAEDSALWAGGLEMALAEFSQSDLLPGAVLLCGGGTALKEIQDAVTSPEWAKGLSFALPIRASFIQPSDVRRMSDATGDLTSPQDVAPLALAYTLVESLGGEKILSGILRRAAKSVREV